MRVPLKGRIAAVAVLAALAFAGTSWAIPVSNHAGPFDFCFDEYEDNFVELRRGLEITPGDDLGGTGHCAVNFTGSVGSAGDTWLTRYNNTYGSSWFQGWNGICMRADVLSARYNNSKGGGLVALLQTDPGDKGLFALLINNGNTDRVTLNTIDPNTGKIVQLASGPLGSAITENAWYRLDLELTASGYSDSLHAEVRVFSFNNPSNPFSGLASLIGSPLVFNSSLSALGLNSSGYVGMASWGKSTNNGTSITNFEAQDNCEEDD